MDSMRTLNTSLPRSPREKRDVHPPEQLIQTFKTAALSVTNLYKTAVADQKTANETGYQEALDDLLMFLDKENMGLDDGEGWKIRRWATERLNSNPPVTAISDDEEERVEVAKGARYSSPNSQPVSDREIQRQTSPLTSPIQPPKPPTSRSVPVTMPAVVNMQTPTERFTFCSPQSLPQDTGLQPSDNIEANRASSPAQTSSMPISAVRVEVVPRGSRPSHRNGRNNSRSSTSVRLPTSMTGSKRRLPFPEYFDIGGFGDGKDGQGGGGKRGRFV